MQLHAPLIVHDSRCSRAVIGNDHTITRQVPNARWSPQRNFGVRGPKTARNRHRDAWRGRSEARRKSRVQGDSDDSGFPDFVTPQHSGAISSTKNIWTKEPPGRLEVLVSGRRLVRCGRSRSTQPTRARPRVEYAGCRCAAHPLNSCMLTNPSRSHAL